MSHLIDDEGRVYKQGPFSNEWRQQEGLFGPEKEADWLGRPNVARDLLGRPEPARTIWGEPIRSAEGHPLYRPAGTSISSSGGDAAAAALGLLLSIGLVILLVYLVGAVLALLIKILVAIYNGWRSLVQRYPRGMLVVHLLLGTTAVGYGLRLTGFSLEMQLGGAALVPALWGWLWLTRRLPMVFMPINAVLVGGGLWLAAQATQITWGPTWARLTTGLPLVNNLPLVLAILPLTLWLWGLGSRCWPEAFRPLNLLALGALLCFVLMRVWTDWLPLWAEWTAPVPILPPAGWLVFLLPPVLWLWRKGQARWPLPFTALNLLVFGGLLGLTAYHTQPAWLATWRHWMAGLPFAAAPILTISLAPATLWGWSWASRRWTRVFAIPNLLLTGGILWLVLDRTRPLWADAWQAVWGDVPLRVDPALLFLILPLAVWAWRRGGRRWPRYWGAMRALLVGGILWWMAERTRVSWQADWWNFTGSGMPDLALLAGLMPLLLWSWARLRRRWPRALQGITWVAVTLILGWTVGRLLPDSTLTLRAAVALSPLAVWGWLWLLRRHPRVGWPLTLLPWAGLGLLVWLAPDRFQALLTALSTWLARQGLPIGWQ